MKKILILFVLFVSSSICIVNQEDITSHYSQLPVPIPPQANSFESNITFTSIVGGSKFVSKGYMWYNLKTNSKRQDYPVPNGGNTMTAQEFLEVYGNGVPEGEACWIWPSLNPPECSVLQTWGPITVDIFSWIYGATYQGQFTVDEQVTNMWNYTGEVSLTIYINLKGLPVRLLQVAFTGDSDMWDFTNFQFNKVPIQSIFNVPSYCPNNTNVNVPKPLGQENLPSPIRVGSVTPQRATSISLPIISETKGIKKATMN